MLLEILSPYILGRCFVTYFLVFISFWLLNQIVTYFTYINIFRRVLHLTRMYNILFKPMSWAVFLKERYFDIQFYVALVWFMASSVDGRVKIIVRTIMMISSYHKISLLSLWDFLRSKDMFPKNSRTSVNLIDREARIIDSYEPNTGFYAEAQADDFKFDLTSFLSNKSIVFSLVTLFSVIVFVLSKEFKGKETSLMNVISNPKISSISNNAKNVRNIIEELLASITKWYFKNTRKDDPLAYIRYEYPALASWMELITSLYQVDKNMYAASRVLPDIFDQAFKAKVRIGQKIVDKGAILNAHYTKTKIICDELQKRIATWPNFDNPPRQNPIMLYITGPPGTGKTNAFGQVFMYHTLKKYYDIKNKFESHIFNKTRTSEYHQGYDAKKHWFWVEEVFDRKVAIPTPKGEDEGSFFKDLDGIRPVMLNMADIESKGSTPFISTFVGMTSNTIQPNLGGHVEPEGLLRKLLFVIPIPRDPSIIRDKPNMIEKAIKSPLKGMEWEDNLTQYHRLEEESITRAYNEVLETQNFEEFLDKWDYMIMSSFLEDDSRNGKTVSFSEFSSIIDTLWTRKHIAYLKAKEKHEKELVITVDAERVENLEESVKENLNQMYSAFKLEAQSDEDTEISYDSIFSQFMKRLRIFTSTTLQETKHYWMAFVVVIFSIISYYFIKKYCVDGKDSEDECWYSKDDSFRDWLQNSGNCSCQIHKQLNKVSKFNSRDFSTSLNELPTPLRKIVYKRMYHSLYKNETQSDEFHKSYTKNAKKGKRARTVYAQGEAVVENRTVKDGEVFSETYSPTSLVSMNSSSQSFEEFRLSLLTKSAFFIGSKDTTRYLNTGLGIYGTWAVMPNHTLTMPSVKRDLGFNVYFVNDISTKYWIDLRLCEVKRVVMENVPTDLVFIKLPIKRQFKDIRNKFVKDHDTSFVYEGSPVFVGISHAINIKAVDTVCVNNIYGIEHMAKVKDLITWTNHDSCHRIPFAVQYIIPTGKRSCGSIVCSTHPRIQDKIIGIHIGGDGISGYGIVLSYETIMDNLTLPVEAQSDAELPFEVVGFHEPVPMNNRSQYKKSVIANFLHKRGYICTKQPAKMRPSHVNGELKNPMIARLKKFQEVKDTLTSTVLNAAVGSLREVLFSNPRASMKLLDFDEMFFGFENLNSVKNNTSMGLPYCLDENHKRRSKKYWVPVRVSGSEIYYPPGYHETLHLVKQMIDDLRNGVKVEVVVVVALKDELLPIKKVIDCDTRIFYIFPFILNLVFRIYFGSFLSMIISQRIDNACGVGINPHGQDWKKIHDRMSTFPKGVVLDADGKNFETTFFSDQKDEAIIELINSIYEKSESYNNGDNEIRLALWDLVRRNTILVDGILYKLPGGNTSGNAVTLLKNTMNNLLTYRAMWYAILEERNIPFKEYEYNDCCRDLATGDDIIINKREDVDFINMKTLSAMFLKHGMIITPADKSPIEDYVEKNSVLQLDYCSRGFNFDEHGFITAPLKYTSIMGMLFWVHGDKKLLCSKMNADTALQELYYYGREHYKVVAEAIVQGFRHKNVVYHAKTYDEQHAERMDRYTSNSAFRLDMY